MEISEEPRPREIIEVITPSADRDAELLPKVLVVTSAQDEIQKLRAENDLNVVVEQDPIDCTSNQIIMHTEMKEDNFSVKLDNTVLGQGDPEESIDTMVSSEDKDIQPDSMTGILKHEIDELKGVEISEVAGSNKDEEGKQKNEDQAVVATKAYEITQVEAESVTRIVKNEMDRLKGVNNSEVAGSNKDEEAKEKNEALSSQIVFLHHNPERGIDDQEHSIDANINNSLPVDIPSMEGITESIVPEVEQEGVLHDSIKHTQINESSTAVETDKEVAIAADHSTLISSMDHEKSDIGPSETCEDETVGAEHEGVSHDCIKYSEINEESSMIVEAEKEVAIAADHNTLISLIEHEKSDIGSSETCEDEIVSVEHEGVLHDSIKHSKINEESSTIVETEREVAIAVDHHTLVSLTDNEKSDIGPSETCEDETVAQLLQKDLGKTIVQDEVQKLEIENNLNVALEEDPIDSASNQITTSNEMKNDSSSVIPDMIIPRQEDPGEGIETIIPSEDKYIQLVSGTETAEHEIDKLKHIDTSEATRSSKDEETKENEDQATLETRGWEIKHGEVENEDGKLESLSQPEQSRPISHADEPLDLTKPTDIPPAIIELNTASPEENEMEISEEPRPREIIEVITPSADRDVELLPKDLAVTSAQDEIQKLEIENDLNVVVEQDPIDCTSNQIIMPTEMKADSFSVIPDNTVPGQGDPEESIDTMVSSEDKDIQLDSKIGILKHEIDELKGAESSEVAGSIKDEEAKEKNEDQIVVVTKAHEITQVEAGGQSSITEGGDLKIHDPDGKIQSISTFEKSNEIYIDEPLHLAPNMIEPNEISLAMKEMEFPKEPPPGGSTEATISSGDEHVQRLQEDPAVRAVPHVQKVKTENDSNATSEDLEGASLFPSHKDMEREADPMITVDHKNSNSENNVPQKQEEEAAARNFQAGGETPPCAEPSFKEAKGEEEKRITDEIKEETRESRPTEITNTAEDSNERSKVIPKKEEPETEYTERAENKGVKTDEAKDAEKEVEVQTGENSGSEVPLIAEKDPVDLTNNNTIMAYMKDESSNAVPEKKIQVQEDPDKSTETVISSEYKDIQPVSMIGTPDLVQEEQKYVKTSEAGAEADKIESGKSQRTTHDYKEIPESSISMESAKSSEPEILQASADETREKAEDIEFQDSERLHVPLDIQVSYIETITENGINVIDLTPNKQEPQAASSLAPEKHITLEADPKVIQGPKNSECVTQVQPEAAAKDFQAGEKNSSCTELDRESASKEEPTTIDETKQAKGRSLPTDTTKVVASSSEKTLLEVDEDFNEGSKLKLEKDELHNENAGAAEDEPVKSNEDKEEIEEGSSSEAPVIVEATRDVDAKVSTKKSHNILSGVGSKVKHSIAKVKKAITGKHSHPKPPSPKEGKGKN